MAKKSKKSQYRQELEAELKPLLQSANMKLLNIEMLAKQEGFEGIENFAYYNALRSIREIRGEEFKRFNMPKNTHQMEKTLRNVKRFLDSTTSTKAGIVDVFEKNAASLNEKMGSNMSWQQMGNFLRAASFEDAKADFDSETAVILIKSAYKYRNLGKEKFVEKLRNHQIDEKYGETSLDEVNSETLADFVDENVSWDELFPVE